MIFLLELKESMKKIYNKYDVYLVPAVKFLMAFLSFCMLNISIGYMTKLKNPVIALVAAALCAFLPSGFTIFILSVFMLIHLYAISAELAAIVLCIVLVMYLLYFRFTPKQGYLLIVTAMLCWLKMPYLLPIAVGLCSGVLSMIPVCFGIIIYYIIQTASAYETAITNQSVSDSMQQISYILESFINNKECLILLLASVITIVVVYCIRRLRVDNAWSYAIIAGTAVLFVVMVTGDILLNAKISLVFVIVGIIFGLILGYLCQIVFFSVDYKRTEFVQYEDDEYYYYVKAVPKINIVNEDVKVKQINARKTRKTDDLSNVRDAMADRNAATLEPDDDENSYYQK